MNAMPALDALWPIALRGLAPVALIAAATWIASVARRDVSLVDRVWSVMIAAAAVAYAWPSAWTSARALALLGLVLAWAVRLAGYITWRNWGHGEDRR